MRSAPAAGLLCALGALLAAAGDAAAQPASPATSGTPAEAFRSKKDRWLDAKTSSASDPQQVAAARAQWEAALDQRIGEAPPEVINVYNIWNREDVVVDADPKSPDASLPQDRVNEFLRCHFTNQPTEMDPRLFGVLLEAARHFKVNRVNIVSGFRAPKYNLMLRKKGHQVARLSQHTLGHAVDFRLPGVPTKRLRAFARSLRLGGVGYYPHSRFVHVDVGPIRFWTGS